MVKTLKKALLILMIVLIGAGEFPSAPISVAAGTQTITVPVSFTAGQRFSPNSSFSNIATTISVPTGYKIKSYQVWQNSATGVHSKGTMGGNIAGNKITIPTFSGSLVDLTKSGFTSNTYFSANRLNNKKAWQFSVKGTTYRVTPRTGDACWSGTTSTSCIGSLPTRDDEGKTIPTNVVRTNDGWAIVDSDGFPGPTSYEFHGPSGMESVPKSDVVSSSIKITAATPQGSDHKVIRFGKGSDGNGQLSVATHTVASNGNGIINGTTLRYDMATATNWAAKTYFYQAELRVTLEEVNAPSTPYLECSCTANPSTVTFADRDISVNTTLNATLKNQGSATIKNWSLSGKLADGSQAATQAISQTSASVSHIFNFNIPKEKLSGVESYTQVFVLTAVVNFVDGTSQTETVECTTTVSKSGAPTPTPTPDPGEPEPTPEPKFPIKVDIGFVPNTIFTGEQSRLDNNSINAEEFNWTFSPNLDDKNLDPSEWAFGDMTFTVPGTYAATFTGTDRHGYTEEKTTYLFVNDPKPIAVISGISRWIQDRPFPSLHNLDNSYTPLASRGITIDWTKSETRYKKREDSTWISGWPDRAPSTLGFYDLEGRVYDSAGRVSEWATWQLEVVPDEAPSVTITSQEEGVRNAQIPIYIDAQSPDGDIINRIVIEERFESAAWTVLYDGANKDTHYATYTTVGKRQYRVTAWENYGLSATSPTPATTTIINMAPIVDYDAYGVILQPDQGENSTPPITNYTPDSIWRSWSLKAPYVGGDEGKIGWKPTSTSLTTRNAIDADFNANYNLANNLEPMTPWVGRIDKIYAGYKVRTLEQVGHYYTYTDGRSPENKDWIFTIRDAWTGSVLGSYTHHGSIIKGYYIKPHPTNVNYAYFMESDRAGIRGSALRLYDVTTGAVVEEYLNITNTLPGGSEHFNNVRDIEFSEDGRDLYIIYVYSNGKSSWDIRNRSHVSRYSLAYRSIIWDKVIRSNEDIWESYDLADLILDSTGGPTIVINTVVNNGMDGNNRTSMFQSYTVDGNVRGFTAWNPAHFSKLTVSEDKTRVYATYRRWHSGNFGYTTQNGVAMLNATTGVVSTLLKPSGGIDSFEWDELATSIGNKNRVISTPFRSVIYEDGTVLEFDTRNPQVLFETFARDNADPDPLVYVPGQPYAANELPTLYRAPVFAQPNGHFAQAISGVLWRRSTNTGSTNVLYTNKILSISAMNQNRVLIGNENNTNFRYEPAINQDPSRMYISVGEFRFSDSTKVTPDGSIFVMASEVTGIHPSTVNYYAQNIVIPFKGEPNGDFPILVDDNTVRVNSETWGGLFYDPTTNMKNQLLDFNLAVNSAVNSGVVGAGIRIQDEKNFYSMEWVNNTITLYKVVNGVKTKLSDTVYARAVGIPYMIRISALGDTISVFINNAQVLTATDGTYPEGSAGLLSLGQQQATFSAVKRTNYGDSFPVELAGIALINEPIKYDILFNDVEMDPKDAEAWTYIHDATYFANSLGVSSVHGQTFASPILSLDKPGLYTITYKASDNPNNPAYSKWSEPVTKELYVHRRPIAIPDVRFTGMVYAAGEALDYDTHDQSYDPDIPDRLDEKLFRTRYADETAWTTGKRALYNRPGVELIIQEQVKDLYGVWSYWEETRVYKDALPPVNQHPPTMVITSPKGTLANPAIYSNSPTIVWTYSDPENDPQERYRLVFKNADLGIFDFMVELDGDDLSYEISPDKFPAGRTTSVQGQVYSKGAWSNVSNEEFFKINTPPTTTLANLNGATAGTPVYTRLVRPTFNVNVTDAETPIQIRQVEMVFHEVATGNEITKTATYFPIACGGACSYAMDEDLNQGLYYWKARSNDGMSWGEFSDIGYFFVDSVKPLDVEEVLEVEPNAVTVNFNAFSDPDPSSGHNRRIFYMQQIDASGITWIDLNNDGTTEYSIQIPNGTTSYRVGNLVVGRTYRLTVIDFDNAGNEGHYEYIEFITNRPPVAGFEVKPDVVYEGDTLLITSTATDPDPLDADKLTIVYTITSPTGVQTILNGADVSHRVLQTGSWTIRQLVTDPHGSFDQATMVLPVFDLSLTPTVTHTEKFLENLGKWNKAYPTKTRTLNTFWKEEAFVLSSTFTDIADPPASSVQVQTLDVSMVRVSDTHVEETLIETLNSNDDWTNTLWKQDLRDRLVDGEYDFIFKANWNNGWSETETVRIIIDGSWMEIGDSFRTN
ncbi:hypothetical protein D3C78_18440 [compost metagenome]